MRYYLAITTSVLAFTSASLVRAEDCAITDCSALGYTETSNRGNCLKCPFGNAWACPGEQCSPDYQYTCTGTGYAGGSGEACDGKYQSCTCASGYEWKDGTCQKEILKPEWGKCNGSAKNCNIGDILYSDGTCSPQNISGKTPIAVVVYKSDDGNCAQAMALNSVGNYVWGPYGTDISTLQNYASYAAVSLDFASCKNTSKIIVNGKNEFQAAWAAHEYKTEGTSTGNWCLPGGGIMVSIKINMSAINNGFNLSGGTPIIETNSHLWSSSEYSNIISWCSFFATSGLDECYKDSSLEVRPVLEF